MTATNPYPLEGIDASGEEMRTLIEAVFGVGPFTAGSTGVPTVGNGGYGVVGPESFKVTGSGASVSVAAGLAVVKGSEGSGQHGVVVGNDAAYAIGSIPTAVTQRYDLITVQVRDAEYSGSNNDGPIARTAGTASSTPTDPTPPASSIVLARLRVDSTGVYQIDDLRPYATAQGGEYLCTSDTIPTVLYPGMKYHVLDTGRTYRVDDSLDAVEEGGWVTFTPTISGWTIGNGASSWRYCRTGRRVDVQGAVTFGSTTSAPSTLNISTPFSVFNNMWSGFGACLDASTGEIFPLLVRTLTSDVIQPFPQQASGSYVVLNNNGLIAAVPFTWVAGDSFALSLTFETDA